MSETNGIGETHVSHLLSSVPFPHPENTHPVLCKNERRGQKNYIE